MAILQRTWLGNPVSEWVAALAVSVAVIIAFQLVRRLLVHRVSNLSQQTETHVDDFVVTRLQQTHPLFLLIVALYAGALILTHSDTINRSADHIVIVALFIQGGIWGGAAINFWQARYRQERLDEDAGSVTVMSALAFVGKMAIWSVVVLLILDNIGVEVTSLIAGLGIGGVAVALAVQNILEDLFASLSIVLDKPFVIGDFVVVGDFAGTIEQIGLKTTRLRSLSGEQLVFANSDLLQSRIRNYKRMEERRVVFRFGVLYEMPYDKLKTIPDMVRNIIESQELTRFDRAHFAGFGDSALNFEVVYYVLTAEYNPHMDIQQAINLELYRRFEEEGIDFAYPTRTLHVKEKRPYSTTSGGR